MAGRRVRRTRSGEVTLRLGEEERQVLRSLPGQLRRLLLEEPGDPGLRRLSPPAYAHDAEHESEYRRYMGDDLRDRRLAALEVMDATVDAERLSEEEAQAWLAALNSLRLVLGTRLDISEETAAERVDPDDPQAPALALYGYLSWLEDQLVEALAGGL